MATFTWGSVQSRLDRFVKQNTGTQATRYGRVNTVDLAEAARASGLPKVGDPFDAQNYPLVKVRSVSIEPLYGGQQLGQGVAPAAANDGTSEVTIEYDSGTGSDHKPTTPGETFTEFEAGSTGQNVYFGAPEGNDADIETIGLAQLVGPLNDGDGVSLDVPTVTMSVVKAYDKATAVINFAGFIGLLGKINKSPVTLPGVYGTGLNFGMGKGQLLYQGPQVQVLDDLIVVRHVFKAAPDHNYLEQVRGPDGKATAKKVVRMRNYAEFSGLW